MTFDLAKSFWNYNDPTYGIIKNRITEETLKIVANGNDDYTITGSFKAIDEDDKNTELEIRFIIRPVFLRTTSLTKIFPNSFHNTIQIRIYSPFANAHSSLLKFQNPADNRSPASPEDRTNLAPHIPGFRPAAPHTLPTITKNPNKKQK